MASNLTELLNEYDAKKYAVDAGSVMHEKLRSVRVLSDFDKVDSELKKCVESCAGLSSFFIEKARTEVPVAGIINGNFISRRIDRLVVDDENKIVRILDYKTDIEKETYREKYIAQLDEYEKLMRQIYPEHKIEKYILWLHDWTLEKL